MDFKRLSEPSTYAGLTGIMGMIGVNVPEGMGQFISWGLASIFGVMSIFMSEKGNW